MRWPLFALLLLGCSTSASEPSEEACPSDRPTSCPTPSPIYADVQPILTAHCTSCHSASGIESTRPLDSYDATFRTRTTVMTQLVKCAMPPAGEPKLSAEERRTLLAWLVCGAPNTR